MSKIRYVCLSDLHLGADNSLLTYVGNDGITDTMQTPSVLSALGSCLRHLVSQHQGSAPATLVLNGDLLETSLASVQQAAMGFDRFIEVFYPANEPHRFTDRIVYVPGNHDHHQWKRAQEQLDIKAFAECPPDQRIAPPASVTPIFDAPKVESVLIETLMRRHSGLGNAQVGIAYPDFGLRSDDGKRVIVFNHGHYLESTYRALTEIINLIFPMRKIPLTIAELEAENGQWIDFMWSTLGSTGVYGEDIKQIYKAMQNTNASKSLIDSLAQGLAEREPSGLLMDRLQEEVLSWMLKAPFNHVLTSARADTSAVLNADARAGLDWYVGEPLRLALGGKLPDELCFVFGHTHKPFTSTEPIGGRQVEVYNTGGWVVDTETPAPINGGSAILVDDDLNVVNLRLYNEAEPGSEPRVWVESTHDNPLLDAMRRLVEADAEPWALLRESIGRAIPLHNRTLRESNQSFSRALGD